MNNSRFVIDTNVLISAFVFKSKNPGDALKRCFLSGKVVLSTEVVTEYRTRLLDKKFDPFISIKSREEILIHFADWCEWVDPGKIIHASRDVDDNKFLELAMSANASCIITGDKDLLVLHPFEHISIITPRDFLEKY